MIHSRTDVHRTSRAEPNGLCNLDPTTLAGLALGAAGSIGGALIGKGSGAATPPDPAQPEAPAAVPQQQQPNTPPSRNNRPQAPTFLGGATPPPPSQSGTKTLLGQ